MMWSNERTAGTQLGWAGLPAVLLLFGLLGLIVPGTGSAEENGADAAKLRADLAIGGALKLEFFAAEGKAYTVEGESADGSWAQVYGPVYGKNKP
ncbi:MAG: hypothetical protein ACR2RV_01030, partial [Verrucomicrobiales bacterium]